MAAPLPLTPARRSVLAVGVPIVLAVIVLAVWGWADAGVRFLAFREQVGYSVRFSVPVTSGQVRVTNSNGDLTVRPVAGHRIEVQGKLTGTFHRPGCITGPRPGACNSTRAAGWASGSARSSSPSAPRPGSPCPSPTPSATCRPRICTAAIGLSDNSGDLAVSALTGTIRLNDSFGNITARNLAGSILLVNNSGDIQGSGFTGDTQIRDSFGNVSVTGLAAADVTASNNSGDVVLSFSRVPDHVQVTDAFGNVTLELPPGPATYRVQAQTTFGNRTVSVPQSPSAAHVITVTNNSGDITIANEPGNPPSAPSVPSAPQPARPPPRLTPARCRQPGCPQPTSPAPRLTSGATPPGSSPAQPPHRLPAQPPRRRPAGPPRQPVTGLATLTGRPAWGRPSPRPLAAAPQPHITQRCGPADISPQRCGRSSQTGQFAAILGEESAGTAIQG